MTYENDRRGVANFRIEIDRQSLLQKNSINVSDNELVITFSELPENLTLQKSAIYNDEPIPGRSEPWKVYSYSGSTLIDFNAKLLAMGTEITPGALKRSALLAGQVGTQVANRLGIGGEFGVLNTWAPRLYRNIEDLATDKSNSELNSVTFEEVHKKAAILESLVYPQYNEDGISFPPPLVWLNYGSNFRRRGIIKDVRLQYMKPWVPDTGLSMIIDCGVVMEEVNFTPKGYSQVRNFQRPENGAAGQAASGVPFKSRILNLARGRFGL